MWERRTLTTVQCTRTHVCMNRTVGVNNRSHRVRAAANCEPRTVSCEQRTAKWERSPLHIRNKWLYHSRIHIGTYTTIGGYIYYSLNSVRVTYSCRWNISQNEHVAITLKQKQIKKSSVIITIAIREFVHTFNKSALFFVYLDTKSKSNTYFNTPKKYSRTNRTIQLQSCFIPLYIFVLTCYCLCDMMSYYEPLQHKQRLFTIRFRNKSLFTQI